MSLARGFINAGCQSVITTLWPVSNEATNRITNNFYQHLSSRYSKHTALRQSQLDYLNDGNTDGLGAHPFFWAGYISVGNTKPISINRRRGFNLLVIGFILMVVGLVIWKNRK